MSKKRRPILTRHLPEKCRLECALLSICLGRCRQQALTRENDFFGVDCRYEVLKQVLENFMEEADMALPMPAFLRTPLRFLLY